MFDNEINDCSLEAGLVGLALLIAASACGVLAQAHMRWLGTLCGGTAAHCGWCYAAAMLSVAAGAAFALAIHLRSSRGLTCVKVEAHQN